MTETSEHRRELSHRASNGIEVSLFWTSPTNRVTIALVNTRLEEGFEFDVDGSDALDAFYHPYAYLPRHTVDPWQELLAA